MGSNFIKYLSGMERICDIEEVKKVAESLRKWADERGFTLKDSEILQVAVDLVIRTLGGL